MVRPGRVVFALFVTSVACAIGWLAFVYGDQPIRGDGIEYRRLAEVMIRQGFWEFASDLRTYGYPGFLALVMAVVGTEQTSLRSAVFAVQLLVYIGAAGMAAVRIGRAVGPGVSGVAIFGALALNPFPLLHTVQVLTDLLSTVLILLAVVLSLPQAPGESRRRVGLAGAVALFLVGFAIMVRPANLIVAPALVLVWFRRRSRVDSRCRCIPS